MEAIAAWFKPLQQWATSQRDRPSPAWRQLQQVLQQRLQQNPNYRFQNALEVEVAASLGLRLDVNCAAVEDWLRLPEMTPAQAQVLVQLRQQGFFFAELEDVAQALGLDAGQLKAIAPILVFRYYESEPEIAIAPCWVNRAKYPEILQTLPGVNEAIAREIIHQRLLRGPYRDIADFQRRLQLSPEAIAQWLPILRF